ncbi:MAG: sigma-70 family RNA polymerase sigma factor [Planctomycetota bacterium]
MTKDSAKPTSAPPGQQADPVDDNAAIDRWLVQQIRDGDSDAWQRLIDRYEGRLLAYVDSRLRNRSTAEDIVQEAFIGFLISLPNYDGSRPLEAYLFSICGYKLTDHLRRQGRRPAIQMRTREGSDAGSMLEPSVGRPGASTIARSGERRQIEAEALGRAIGEQIQRWQSEGNWAKLRVLESIFVGGLGNKEVAEQTNLSQQQVANYKSDFQIRLRAVITRMGLNQDVFPELAEPS